MASGKPARVSDGSRGHAEPGDGARLDVHASTLVVGEHGVLVRGPSGSGKTRLVLALMAEAGRDAFARLVADDRTLLSRHAGRIVARPHPAIAGLVERRGLGIVTVPSEPACRVHGPRACRIRETTRPLWLASRSRVSPSRLEPRPPTPSH